MHLRGNRYNSLIATTCKSTFNYIALAFRNDKYTLRKGLRYQYWFIIFQVKCRLDHEKASTLVSIKRPLNNIKQPKKLIKRVNYK